MQGNNRKESGQNQGWYIFECVMSLLYLSMSCMLLFTKIFEDAILNKNLRLALGILLGLYGIFRVFRAVKKFQNR